MTYIKNIQVREDSIGNCFVTWEYKFAGMRKWRQEKTEIAFGLRNWFIDHLKNDEGHEYIEE